LSAEILRVHPDEPQPDRIEYIVSCLRKGNVIALPTDTFYGLAVDPVNLRAVEQIYQLKSRQKHKPLSLLISSVEQAEMLAKNLPAEFYLLAEAFWPGPLTLIVQAAPKLPLKVTANSGNVALRVPAAQIPLAVIRKAGIPVTATSANLSGASECTSAAAVRDQLAGRLNLIVDGGPSPHEVPSTIVDLTIDEIGKPSWRIQREGAIPAQEITALLSGK